MGNKQAHQFAVEIARIAQENNSEDIVVLDLAEISPVTELVVIATGTSDRQMKAVADLIMEYGRGVDERPIGVAGLDACVWLLLDFVDVVFHIFLPPYREFYDLELLWGDAPHVEWTRSESA